MKLGSLNVSGLKKKIDYPELNDLINRYDIFCVSETHIDTYDIVDIPGFVFFSHPRSREYKRKSGGIGIYVRSNISKFIHFEPASSEYVLWVSVDKQLTKLTETLYLGAVYIPPENSRFYTNDDFEILETSVANFCSNNKFVILAGDFNSRTSELNDFIPSDPFICDLLEIDLETQTLLNKHAILEGLSIPLNRKSLDRKTNSHGFRMIELCRNSNLFILNGRLLNDTNGSFTFKERSVIDYVLATADCFTNLSKFEVLDPDPLLSDGHSVLEWEIGSKHRTHVSEANNSNPSYPRWESDKAENFNDNINSEQLNAVLEELDSFPQNQNTIDNLTDKIAKIFKDSAEKSFNPIKKTYKSKINKKKPWFGPECQRARKRYHRAKTKYRNYPSGYNKNELNHASKSYKKIIHYYVSKFKFDRAKQLRSLASSSPKEYWKFLRKLKPRLTENPSPTIDEFFTHFKNVNNTDSNEEQQQLNVDNTEQNSMLNAPILSNEILKCINNLCNSKASSPTDNILNEYIKNTKKIMLPIYTKLFNCIFDTGCIPSSWLSGIIIPIYKNKGNPSEATNYRPITIQSCLGNLFTSVLNNRLTPSSKLLLLIVPRRNSYLNL